MSLDTHHEAHARELRERLGAVGVWLGPIAVAPWREEREALARIEQLGYGAVWFGEIPGNREALSHAAMLLAASERITVATGIANIWARDAMAAINGAEALNEAYGGRFLLGLGVSHAPAVEVRGHEYGKPVTSMGRYLDAIEANPYYGPAPASPSPVVLAALRPRMLELARDRSAGAHPYFVPTSHTPVARAILGPGPLLAPEQAVLLDSDPVRARELARRHMAIYLTLPNYVNNLRELGFGDGDFADGGSDELVDAIVAWGDVDAIAQRVSEHLAAGADHVAVQVCANNAADALATLERLAPALLALARPSHRS